jgi:phosphoribosylformimino-5-aminoimidazole carboxamide ribotide isomerase
MRIIPAIDLKSGRLSRLSKGDPDTAKYYDALGDPIEASVHWERTGATFLHVIDLDAAMGTGDNNLLVRRILGAVHIPVQVGGGIRTLKNASEILEVGASRVILGTLAFEKLDELDYLLSTFNSERIVVALDYSEGKVLTEGWKKHTEIPVIEAIERFRQKGVRRFLLTATGRDGLMVGPDVDTLSRSSRISGIHIIAAGGIGRLSDLEELRSIGVEEVVVGKALYEGRFTLAEAIARFKQQ